MDVLSLRRVGFNFLIPFFWLVMQPQMDMWRFCCIRDNEQGRRSCRV